MTEKIPGPVYIRMLRGEVPRLFDSKQPLEFGKARVLSEGKDLTLFSGGICTEEAMRATQALTNLGVSIEHLHISTLKPFTDPLVLKSASQARFGVITMENHSIMTMLA